MRTLKLKCEAPGQGDAPSLFSSSRELSDDTSPLLANLFNTPDAASSTFFSPGAEGDVPWSIWGDMADTTVTGIDAEGRVVSAVPDAEKVISPNLNLEP